LDAFIGMKAEDAVRRAKSDGWKTLVLSSGAHAGVRDSHRITFVVADGHVTMAVVD
jgi:predicted RNA binding protein YcfA (HicA-like mRNA interferase family)